MSMNINGVYPYGIYSTLIHSDFQKTPVSNVEAVKKVNDTATTNSYHRPLPSVNEEAKAQEKNAMPVHTDGRMSPPSYGHLGKLLDTYA